MNILLLVIVSWLSCTLMWLWNGRLSADCGEESQKELQWPRWIINKRTSMRRKHTCALYYVYALLHYVYTVSNIVATATEGVPQTMDKPQPNDLSQQHLIWYLSYVHLDLQWNVLWICLNSFECVTHGKQIQTRDAAPLSHYHSPISSTGSKWGRGDDTWRIWRAAITFLNLWPWREPTAFTDAAINTHKQSVSFA